MSESHLWLEEFTSPEALDWVRTHNAASAEILEADPRYAILRQEALNIAGARDRIPAPSFLRGEIYNFWQDETHLRGLWRKTSLADYRTADPAWTPVLDIDALGRDEGKSWVLHGASVLMPEARRCLIMLSDGGEDADEAREFDLEAAAFVEGGFMIPRGKQRIAWEDEDHLLISREWTPGELTGSGYPFVVRRLVRGQALEAAEEVFRGGASDGGYGVSPSVLRDDQGDRLTLFHRPLDTYRHETHVLTPRGVERLGIPDRAEVIGLFSGRMLISPDEAWTVAGETFAAGSLLQVDLDRALADPANLKPSLIWAPGPRQSLAGAVGSLDRLVVGTLDNVRTRVWVFTPRADGGWTRTPMNLPDNLSGGVGSIETGTNRAFVSFSGFTTPATLVLADLATGEMEPVKTAPSQFDASGHVVEQFEAISSDGTAIPYFLVRPVTTPYDGSTPTLLYAYGGFQVSLTPSYAAMTGKLWLERGGAYVLANIRGGGEFGPAWHQAGLGTRRQIIYDDFAAVAEDLIARRITSPRRLGIQGGSNGGLLMGVQMVQRPQLWNAVVIQVPLLDMIRIGKIAAGASWQGEYGDVEADPAVMEFWLKTSPYHNLKPGTAYPEPFIFTTTKDDRVGPQHARKFAARLEELGLPFFYYENIEGGHGGSADMTQQAHVTALTMTYLQRKLMD
ncbi:MAG TPA: prolyl oligopeptidase family serine peptidase [Caulobacteraceae bacterium]|jgi:prolyl oligopeptidase|nr:prolyl oligopeptidase family serine peptidase [Caulobacteraceae bacterium]